MGVKSIINFFKTYPMKKAQLKLIEGEFLLEDGKEILNNIFSSKINFHQMKNFSSQERLGLDDAMAKKRIPQLREEVLKLEKLLEEARKQNKKLIINSVIDISFTEES